MLEGLSCVVDDNIQITEVPGLTLEVRVAFITGVIASFAEFSMKIVARNKDDLKPLQIDVVLEPPNFVGVTIIPVNTVEASLWVVVDQVKGAFNLVCSRSEIFEVTFFTLVVRK